MKKQKQRPKRWKMEPRTLKVRIIPHTPNKIENGITEKIQQEKME